MGKKNSLYLGRETGISPRMSGQSFGTGLDSHDTRNETKTSF